MLSENLKALRKQKGFSQEELAARLHVVRQTISKWEKGLSVPDADLLARLAEILEVSVTTLLGSPVEDPQDRNALAEQLVRINEQLAIKNRRARRIWKAVMWIVIGLVIINLLVVMASMVSFHSFRAATQQEVVPISENGAYFESNG